MNQTLLKTIAVILSLVFFLVLPVTHCQAAENDDDTLNKGVLIGFFVVIIGVLFWLGFKTDLESGTLGAKPYTYPGEECEESTTLAETSPPVPEEQQAFLVNADGLTITF